MTWLVRHWAPGGIAPNPPGAANVANVAKVGQVRPSLFVRAAMLMPLVTLVRSGRRNTSGSVHARFANERAGEKPSDSCMDRTASGASCGRSRCEHYSPEQSISSLGTATTTTDKRASACSARNGAISAHRQHRPSFFSRSPHPFAYTGKRVL